MDLARAMFGKMSRDHHAHMSFRQRADFAIIVVIFGAVVGVYASRLFADAQNFH